MSDNTNTKMRYSPQISLGNYLQIATMLGLALTSFTVLRAQSEANAKAILELRGAFVLLEQRARTLETENARAEEKFNNILTFMARIDSRLERIEEK